jgi:hypothetical protein
VRHFVSRLIPITFTIAISPAAATQEQPPRQPLSLTTHDTPLVRRFKIRAASVCMANSKFVSILWRGSRSC